LSPGRGGDAAGEIYRVDLDGEFPVDLSRHARVRIPFGDGSLALGSLAVDQSARALFLGEENGTRIYRLTDDEKLTLYATGLHRLAGGSSVALDRQGRLVVVDHVDPFISPGDERPVPGLEPFRDEQYRGPVVFRISLDAAIRLPRRVDLLAPVFPRGWGGRGGGGNFRRLIAVAPLAGDDLVVLTSDGELLRLAGGSLEPWVALPRGQYNRINMLAAPDGAVIVSGGFHVARIFRVAPNGAVTVLAANLGDPEGIALDGRGDLYVAESSLHRIIRLRPFEHGGR
jgi:hypothetical protein